MKYMIYSLSKKAAGLMMIPVLLLSPVIFFASYNVAQAVYPASCCTVSQGGFNPAPGVIDYNWSCTGGPCDSGGGGGGSSIVYPTATLSANPTSVNQGGSSTLTWSSTGATSCAGTNFSTGNATSGSVSVSPSSTTIYSLVCVNSQASATAGTTVAVTNDTTGTFVAYAIDWDMNGTVDEVVPGVGYLNLGTLQTASHSWSTTGVKTFQARTVDSNGNVSGWTPYSITIGNPQCSDGLDNDGNGANDYPADTGCTGTTDTTESGGTFQCSDGVDNDSNGFIDYPADSGCTSAIDNTEIGGSCSGAKTGTITPSPSRVNGTNQTSTLTWTAQRITTSCVISGPGVSQTYPANSCVVTPLPVTTPIITTQSVYTLTCDGTVLGTAIINVVPRIEEF